MFPSVLSREALLINRALELFKASVYFLSKSFSLSPKKKITLLFARHFPFTYLSVLVVFRLYD